MTKKTTPKAAGPATRGLQVTSRTASFWRAGIQFTGEPRVVPLSELTDEQVEAITSEPMLVVHEVDIPPADKA